MRFVISQQRAAVHDGRLVTLGQLILFSTETGDAWLLDTEDRLATRIAQDGVSLPIHIEDIDTSFSVEWKGGYRVRHRLHLCRQGHRKSSKHSWLPNRPSFLIHMIQKFQICLARLLSLEVKTLEGIFFTDGLIVSTCFAHLHSGSQALKGEFLFLRLAMYFDS